MNKTLKIVLIIVGVLIVLVLVAPFLIPVNQFRPTIEEKASAALGRKVEVGNLSLSLISGSLSAENLSAYYGASVRIVSDDAGLFVLPTRG